MRTRMQKWGRSLALRIPKLLAEEADLREKLGCRRDGPKREARRGRDRRAAPIAGGPRREDHTEQPALRG